ncbi:MAG: MlaD family protein [Desulfobacterales bacterium]|jgi:paraquat-inducible protein B
MAKAISKTAIGGFVIGGIALLIAAVILFGGAQFFVQKDRFVLFFQGSVKGLKVGSPVVFRGVEVGAVKELSIHTNSEDLSVQIPVIIELLGSKIDFDSKGGDRELMQQLIQKGLRAQLVIDSLVTGQLAIDMDYYPNTKANLVGSDREYLEIPTIPSTIERLAQVIGKIQFGEIFEKIEKAMAGIEKMIGDPGLQEAFQGIETAAKSADRVMNNADRLIGNADRLVSNLDRQVEPLSASVKTAVDDAGRLLRRVDEQVDPLSGDARRTLGEAQAMLDKAQQSLDSIETLVGERSELRYRLNQSLIELTGALQSVRSFSEYLERHPEALIQGKGNPGRR